MGKETEKALEAELEGIFLRILDPSTRDDGFRRLESKFGDEEGTPRKRGDNVIDFPTRNVSQVVKAEIVKTKTVKPKAAKPPRRKGKSKGKSFLKFIEENAEPLRVLASLLGEVGKHAIELYARTRLAPKPRRPRLTAPKS